MLIEFSKYHGTGNDFIMIDDRNGVLELGQERIEALCHRRFGIGADGLILLRYQGDTPTMVYYNSDGRPSSMCGNGGRCFVAFGYMLRAMEAEGEFLAVDGPHPYKMSVNSGLVSLKMRDVPVVEQLIEGLFMDTGSPHVLIQNVNPMQADLLPIAHKVRYSERFKEAGVNVNLIAIINGQLVVRTYERGVEDETYSCGTGVTAAALAAHAFWGAGPTVPILTKGGELQVKFSAVGVGNYKDIWLIGPATQVYSGTFAV